MKKALMDIPADKLKAAKKTIQLTVEVEGKTYTETFDGTNGCVILVDQGEGVRVRELVDHSTKLTCAAALLSYLSPADQVRVIAYTIDHKPEKEMQKQ